MPDLRLASVCPDDPGKAALLERMASNNTASYKFFWMKALLTLIERGRTEASFLEMGALMTAHAWDPVIFFKLSLGATDKLGAAIHRAQQELGLDDYAKFEQAAEAIERSGNPQVVAAVVDLTRYVRRRFLVPCLKGLEGILPGRLDTAISKASLAQPAAGPYWIEERAKRIHFNSEWSAFILGNLPLVKSWLDLKLARYLQARNPNIPAIVFKLERPAERSLGEPRKFWAEAIRRGGVREIYSGLSFTTENFERFGALSIDHFIPWRYVLHDEFWNLTPMFKNWNSAKGDRLPDLEEDLRPLCRQAFGALAGLRETDLGKRALQSYLGIDPDAPLQLEAGDGGLAAFSDSMKQALVQAYAGAASLGFPLWKDRPRREEREPGLF